MELVKTNVKARQSLLNWLPGSKERFQSRPEMRLTVEDWKFDKLQEKQNNSDNTEKRQQRIFPTSCPGFDSLF